MRVLKVQLHPATTFLALLGVVFLIIFTSSKVSYHQLNTIELNALLMQGHLVSRDDYAQSTLLASLRRSTATATTTTDSTEHRLAGLSCRAYGGPEDSDATALQDMVYWKDIPSDSTFTSPLQVNPDDDDNEYFLTFEPDEGGWNNIRIAMETAVMMGLATGRTLVLPPEQDLYLLGDAGKGGKHKTRFGMADFFHFASIQTEFPNLRVISFQEFLEQEALTGKLHSVKDGKPAFPPGNRTDWNGLGKNWESAKTGDGKILWNWMRQEAALDVSWDFGKCVAAFPSERLSSKAGQELQQALQGILNDDAITYPKASLSQKWGRRVERFKGNPTPVNASLVDRLSEMLADRRELCIYNETMQKAKVIHVKGEAMSGHRLLIHFYAFLFFQDWRMDLWTKRFVRDHLRYVDEIQCAAARVVQAVRNIASERGEPNGRYDSFHIRRGDFQYKDMHMPAEDIFANNAKGIVKHGRTVFVATDEKNMSYFDPLREHYHLLFLNDFKEELGDLNVNYYGMVDQLVASRGDVFIGSYYSTFTGYINRIRGYHTQNAKADGYLQGIIDSYYYTPESLASKRTIMRTYHSIKPAYWAQEFAVGWRDIDHDIFENAMSAASR